MRSPNSFKTFPLPDLAFVLCVLIQNYPAEARVHNETSFFLEALLFAYSIRRIELHIQCSVLQQNRAAIVSFLWQKSFIWIEINHSSLSLRSKRFREVEKQRKTEEPKSEARAKKRKEGGGVVSFFLALAPIFVREKPRKSSPVFLHSSPDNGQ